MWEKKVSLKRPKEREVINGIGYVRKNIKQVISSDRVTHWEFLEETEDVQSAIRYRRDQIALLEQEIKELEGKYDTTT